MCTDELTRMNKNFGSGAYGSLLVCQMQPTVLDITAGFYYQPVVIISITVGLFENPIVMAFFFLRTSSDASINVGFKILAVIGRQ